MALVVVVVGVIVVFFYVVRGREPLEISLPDLESAGSIVLNSTGLD